MGKDSLNFFQRNSHEIDEYIVEIQGTSEILHAGRKKRDQLHRKRKLSEDKSINSTSKKKQRQNSDWNFSRKRLNKNEDQTRNQLPELKQNPVPEVENDVIKHDKDILEF